MKRSKLGLCLKLDSLSEDADRLRVGRYGVIAIERGQLTGIQLRPWPKIITAWEVDWRGRRVHRDVPGDRCWLYYNQPRGHSRFLALKYMLSHRDCSFASFRRALEVLDQIAWLKRSDALVCDAWNDRISDRLFARFGWEAHCPQRGHRHYIKRFYGVYPDHCYFHTATPIEVATC